MITDGELTQLRSDVLETLLTTCTILRASATVDGNYLPGESWGTAAAGVRCRLDPYTNRQDSAGLVGGREANRSYFQLTLPWDADVDDGDRIAIDSATYELVLLHATHSGRVVKRATLAKVAT